MSPLGIILQELPRRDNFATPRSIIFRLASIIVIRPSSINSSVFNSLIPPKKMFLVVIFKLARLCTSLASPRASLLTVSHQLQYLELRQLRMEVLTPREFLHSFVRLSQCLATFSSRDLTTLSVRAPAGQRG
jgi:hypothetical protein